MTDTYAPPEGTRPWWPKHPEVLRAYSFRKWTGAPSCPECGCPATPHTDRAEALASPAMTCPNRRHESFRFAWGKVR